MSKTVLITGDTPIGNVVGADAIAIAQALSSMPRQAFLDRIALR